MSQFINIWTLGLETPMSCNILQFYNARELDRDVLPIGSEDITSESTKSPESVVEFTPELEENKVMTASEPKLVAEKVLNFLDLTKSEQLSLILLNDSS